MPDFDWREYRIVTLVHEGFFVEIRLTVNGWVWYSRRQGEGKAYGREPTLELAKEAALKEFTNGQTEMGKNLG